MTGAMIKFSPLRQTGIISAIAVLLSFAFSAILYLASFGFDENFWDSMTFAIIVPWGISIPLGLYMAKQRERLVILAGRLRHTQRSLRKLNRDLQHKASYDAMTGLPNRETFFDHIEEVRARNESSVLMIIDVDHFKNINDSFGHLVGDRALILLAKVFRKILRKDDFIGRIGGEEFGVLLPDTGEAEGQIIGEMIRHEIENTIFEPHENMRHVITVSIGITGAATHLECPVLMSNADTALFEAKRRGRNQVVPFEPGMRSKPRPFFKTDRVDLAFPA